MDIKEIENYCEYVIRPLEERKKELLREIESDKKNFFLRYRKKRDLRKIDKILYEKLRKLSKQIYGEE